MPGGPAGQVAPYDNNQTEQVHALYVEDAQTLFDARWLAARGIDPLPGRTRLSERLRGD